MLNYKSIKLENYKIIYQRDHESLIEKECKFILEYGQHQH